MNTTTRSQKSARSDKGRVVIGKVRKLLFRGKGVAIAKMLTPHEIWFVEPQTFLFSKGVDVEEGKWFSCTGTLLLTRKYGAQFHVNSYNKITCPGEKPVLNAKHAEIISALLAGEIPGIGADTARILFERLGENILSLTDAGDIEKIKGFGERRAFTVLANIRRFLDEFKS